MSTLTIGGVYTATLTGLAGPWTIHGHATLWAVTDTEDGPHLVLELSDAPTPGEVSGTTSHRAYARGTLSRDADGRRQLVNPLTPQPGPAVIGLGFTLRARRDPADAAHHTEMAITTLADWAPLPDDGSPLGVSALTHLARTAARASELRAVERERDDLVRRLRAGDVPRSLVAAADGRDASRITQLCQGTERAKTPTR
ncbi:hypothetical protein ACFVZ3_22065 [Kitasatospora purpeofusca]|uniref:hypothetical protein n=1 Tax=Kitasatospora purpeofusca TaxID=67352 RepID=UPI0036AF5561